MLGWSKLRVAASARSLLGAQFPHSKFTLHALLPFHRFLPRPLHSAWFSVRSAPFSAQLTQ